MTNALATYIPTPLSISSSQEPTLFSGSLRFNLDPGNHFSDEALHRALHSAGLTELVRIFLFSLLV